MNTIDVHIELRRGRHAVNSHTSQYRVVRSRCHDSGACLFQTGATQAGAILHFH